MELKEFLENRSTEELNEIVWSVGLLRPRPQYNWWEPMESLEELSTQEEINSSRNFSATDKYWRYDNFGNLESTDSPEVNVNLEMLENDIMDLLNYGISFEKIIGMEV